MIIEFKVSNFRSIREQQTFSMVASHGAEHLDNLCLTQCNDKFSLVRAAVLYGANASGKSNLLSALFFARMFIVSSAKESQQGEKIQLNSFAFDKDSCNKPSEFEITFIKDKIRYQYGFVADRNRIFEEWLFAYPLGKAQKWFSRIYDKKNKAYSWHFSSLFKGGKKVKDLTRDNVLFLSNAVSLNNSQLAPVMNWFREDLRFIDSPTDRQVNLKSNIQLIKTLEGKRKLLQWMEMADPSIVDINLRKINGDAVLKNVPEELLSFFKKKIGSIEREEISFIHSGNIPLDIGDESEGTRKLLASAGRWIDALENGRVLIVDELDSSLHPLLVRFLIKIICNPESNKKNSQLIFATHDSSLLDNDLFRRDQIWFVEKDDSNATKLYPLSDFSPRKKEAIYKGYLQGRYGALPYIGEWRF